jgi:formylglycine-generating enzyme
MTRYFACLVMLCVGSITSAAEPKVSERWALLVGVDDYANANDLQYCGADQTALRDRLMTVGFRAENIILLNDKATENKYRPSRGNIEQQLKLVINSAEADDLLVIGFSGHGVSLNGKSFLCPNDASLGDPTTLISLDSIYDQLHDCAARFKLMLVDACRNDPTVGGARSFSATEGTKQLARSLQELKMPEGVVLLNSCAPGEISWEEEKFGHGVFMHYVLEAMTGAGDDDGDGAVSLHELQHYAASRTKSYVIGKFNSTQRPFYRSEGEDEVMDFALLPVRGGAIRPVTPVTPNPNVAPPEHVITNSIGMKFRLIPPGEFLMGSPESDEAAPNDEKPQHRVQITRGFAMGIHEVTVGQYRSFSNAARYKTVPEQLGAGTLGWVGGATPLAQRPQFNWRTWWANQTDEHPVLNITIEDALAFCTWLSRVEGKPYRLPTEAEWEYACRAGTTTRFPGGDDESILQTIANVADASAKQFNLGGTYGPWDDGDAMTSPVGKYQPNAFGLYDMCGNAREFCSDWYGSDYYASSPSTDPRGPAQGESQVVRGGGWLSHPLQARSARRFHMPPPMRTNAAIGFRVVRDQ